MAATFGLSLALAMALGAASLATPGKALASEEGCPGLIARRASPIIPAALAQNEVGLTYVGHATFLIETAAGVKIATDYNDYVRPSVTPDIATMNRAHSTHYSTRPDPGIKTILRGWNPDGGRAPAYDQRFGDVRIRNVVTNIRQWGGESTIMEGNSIFVFEAADLCIAHLGHLHHTLTPEHLKQLGRIDVALVPVDGSYTLDIEGMMEVLSAMGPKLIVPMHFFGQSTLNRFLDRARSKSWDTARLDSASMTLSRETLPGTPRVVVLQGY
ncbi:MBL fold metallo-hydrolase [Enterovirga aerilata]|uniref:MBL fold metallo-hydrolase n=1 Tax=Enterovirga aerilata TaxID=2730920 RepID=A0A849IGH8_9HYPH|nr:MBL fold metallo-hydrolase [Enterovirga sp. DB1703]NNM73023.1 MBL fold metallo-hydrolase [Enterovirga sp. DB1703]